MFNRSASLFQGMTTAQLQTALANCQQAMVDLAAGNKRASINYTQGDSAKGATFTKAEMGTLANMIRELQWLLGLVHTPRERMRRFVFHP